MPVTVSGMVLFAVTDVLFATRPGTIQTCAFICSTRATNGTASRETDVSTLQPKNAKKSP